jgi:hypothetical protein
MPDATILVRKFLLQDAALLALCPGSAPTVPASDPDVPEHIVGGVLPEYANPNVYAPFVTIATEGGTSHPEAPINADRVKVRVWAGINQWPLARQVNEEIETWLHRKNQIDLAPAGFIIISQQTVGAQDLTDPDTGWATVVSFYQITNRAS